MPHPFVVIFGKAIRSVARLRGGGSALPGLFVERISPDFVSRTLSSLPLGVVVISGTNGKTTTTKMVTSLLESQGLTVFTNRTGSNFVRGVAAALLGDIDRRGNLHADIAVLELDEAHAVKFVEVVKPTHSLFLNVMRDQLDRFGEIDSTAKLLQKVAEATQKTVVLNSEDTRISGLAEHLATQEVHYFGLSSQTRSLFPNDDELYGNNVPAVTKRSSPVPSSLIPVDVSLMSVEDNQAIFELGGKKYAATLKISGAYNVFNAAGALALVRAILPQSQAQSLIDALENITPAFGRGETIILGGQPLEIVLVKNPSGFRLGLSSFDPSGYETMIAINDNYADGRDMSWLWDVSFSSLPRVAVVSGVRAYDMGLRLQYDEVETATVNPDLSAALRYFVGTHANSPKRIFCTYTAMLALRKELSTMTEVEKVS